MPAFATHYIFLDEMKNVIRDNADFAFDVKAAGIGTQGPDIFFFHRLIPPFTIYKTLAGLSGKLHHAKPAALFEAFAQYLTFSPSKDVAKSYIYGFILHYALDRNCHPYVYAFQAREEAETRHIHPLAAHNRVEHALDTYLLNKRLHVYPPSDFDPRLTFSSDEAVIEEVAHLLSFVTEQVVGKSVPEKEMARAVTDTVKVQNILADRKGNATRLAHCLEIPTGPLTGYFKLSCSIKPKDLAFAEKYANINNEPWESTFDGSRHTESFEQLFDKAKLDAGKLLDGFEAVCKGEATGYQVTKNLSFDSGLEVTE